MTPSLPTTTRARWALAIALAMVLGCGTSGADVREAQSSGYMTDFAVVYGQVLAAVRDLYPHANESAVAGVIKTAWHPIRVVTGTGGEDTPTTTGQGVGGSGIQTTRHYRKHYFIRFDVAVVGGKPWRVRVKGQASSWRVGEIPVPLKGAEVPHWLKGRTEELQVAIHERLKKYAVPLDGEVDVEAEPVALDTSRWGAIPAAAAEAVAQVHAAATRRDAASLRPLLQDDFVWKDGEAPSADVAVAMWQADAGVTGALAAALEAGCAARGDAEVVCPAAGGPGAAVFSKSGERWLLSRFVASTAP